jgi:hypothetical protein
MELSFSSLLITEERSFGAKQLAGGWLLQIQLYGLREKSLQPLLPCKGNTNWCDRCQKSQGQMRKMELRNRRDRINGISMTTDSKDPFLN